MKMFAVFYNIILIFQNFNCAAQQYLYKEFSIDTAHLVPLSMQETSDNNFSMNCYQYCFKPNAIAIEGCPISTQYIRFDSTFNTILRKDLFVGNSYLSREWTELENGNQFIFSNARANSYCYDYYTLPIQKRVERYEIDKEGNIHVHQIYNDICDVNLASTIPFLQNNHLIFTHKIGFIDNDTSYLIKLNANFEVEDSLIYENFQEHVKLIHVDIDSAYGISAGKALLNFIALDLDSPGYNIRPIASNTSDTYHTIQSTAKDKFGNHYAIVSTSSFSPFELKLIKFTNKGGLIWLKTLPSDLSIKHETIYPLENDIAILSGIKDQISKDLGARIQFFGFDGEEIYRKEYMIDTINIRPSDFVFQGNSVIITGSANKEKSDAPSTPFKTFLLKDDDIFTSNLTPAFQSDLVISPNPTTSSLKFRSAYCQDELLVEFVDLTGKPQYVSFTLQKELNISEFNNGMYFARVKCANETMGIYKIIKQ